MKSLIPPSIEGGSYQLFKIRQLYQIDNPYHHKHGDMYGENVTRASEGSEMSEVSDVLERAWRAGDPAPAFCLSTHCGVCGSRNIRYRDKYSHEALCQKCANKYVHAWYLAGGWC
jgi:hypothetical protein